MAYCTLNPDHADRELSTPREERQGYCSECAEVIASAERIAEKNDRAVGRQAAKDQFMADHPELWQGGKVGAGSFAGQAEWLAYADGEG
jgi:hypothetical protein